MLSFIAHSVFCLLMQCTAEEDKVVPGSICSSACCYYLTPCFVLFDKSHELLNVVLKTLRSWITKSSLACLTPDQTRYTTEISSRVDAVVSLLQLMHKDDKIWQIISSFKAEIDCILESIIVLQVLSFAPSGLYFQRILFLFLAAYLCAS